MYTQSRIFVPQPPANQYHEMLKQSHSDWQEQRRLFHLKLADFHALSPTQQRLYSTQLRHDYEQLQESFQLLKEHFTHRHQADQKRPDTDAMYKQEPARHKMTYFLDQFSVSSLQMKTCLFIVVSDQGESDQLRDLLLQAGFTYLIFASTGSEALQKARVIHLDALLIGSHLPDMSSLDCYDRLCSIGRDHPVPTLFLNDSFEPIPIDVHDKPDIRCIDLSSDQDQLVTSIHELLLLQKTV